MCESPKACCRQAWFQYRLTAILITKVTASARPEGGTQRLEERSLATVPDRPSADARTSDVAAGTSMDAQGVSVIDPVTRQLTWQTSA
ncbi:MAG: hypothetical protein ABI633_00180 [Burkholderiales bacterium]